MTRRPKGLSEAMFKAFPAADCYSTGRQRAPGQIEVGAGGLPAAAGGRGASSSRHHLTEPDLICHFNTPPLPHVDLWQGDQHVWADTALQATPAR